VGAAGVDDGRLLTREDIDRNVQALVRTNNVTGLAVALSWENYIPFEEHKPV